MPLHPVPRRRREAGSDRWHLPDGQTVRGALVVISVIGAVIGGSMATANARPRHRLSSAGPFAPLTSTAPTTSSSGGSPTTQPTTTQAPTTTDPTTTAAPSITTAPTTSPTTSPTTVAASTSPTAAAPFVTTPSTTCTGVALRSGQADIDNNPAGTTFCLSGTNDWTLNPRDGDTFMGPAVLDGGGTNTAGAFIGGAQNVTIESLTIQHYDGGDQQGAINPDSSAAGWKMLDLDVAFNNNVGIDPPANSLIQGGRLHDNGQEGAGGQVGDGVTVDGVEIDHNNTHHVSCGYEAGGFKWVANNVTVKNSKIHDNACKGLWTDINSSGDVIENNQVYDNAAEGIFIEISNHVLISGNTVYGNGFSACTWLWGGGITAASSAGVEVTGNDVYANCNGITGTQQDRPDGNPGLLENYNVHGNTVAGPGGQSGVVADNGADLTTRNITFLNNTYSNGMVFCGFAC
jgi:parallel beta-helix repeat protein